MGKVPLSVCIITRNEDEHITACLQSVRWADEVIVIDSLSDDRTVELARRIADKVVQHSWHGINAQRQFALGLARHPWVLALDADERVSPELEREIGLLFQSGEPAIRGFLIPRRTFYLGRWIHHGGWYPDRKVRLFRKDKGSYRGTDPHDHFVVEGASGTLRGEILHFTYRDFSDQLDTVNRFSSTAAQQLVESGHRFHFLWLLARPPWKFLECYIWKMGFLDGVPGFLIAAASAFNVFARYAKLWERTGASESEKQKVKSKKRISSIDRHY